MAVTLQLSEYELMCRLIEAWTGEKRPLDKTPQQVLETMIDHETRHIFSRLTNIAMLYFVEQLGAGCAIEIADDVIRPQVN